MALCPVCSFEGLTKTPWVGSIPSDELCPRCANQFGYDDAVGLHDSAALAIRHAELRDRLVQFAGDTSPASLPVSLRPDGPYADLFAKRKTKPSPDVYRRYQARERLLHRALTDAHVQALATWVREQPDEGPDTAGARGPELPMFLRQVAAQAIMAKDQSAVAVLVKAAMVLGAWVEDARENTWTTLRFARQVGDAVDGNGMHHLASAAEGIGPVASQAVENHASAVSALPELPVVLHQPSDIALLEEPWTEHAQALRLATNITWTAEPFLSYDHRDRAWSTDQPAFRPQRAPGHRAPSADRRSDVVDALNSFLLTGDSRRVLGAIDVDGIDDYLPSAVWSARYWAGDGWSGRFPHLASVANDTKAEVADTLVVVHRYGAPQLAWRLA